jgi:phosphoglycerol transferase MdoB-like AlkP superfamily enzyme
MSGATRAILVGALAAGVLDLCYAFIVYGPLSYGLTPMQVLQSVAAGWIGRDVSRAGGLGTAALGLATHFMLAAIMAAVFVAAATWFKALTADALIAGLLYGLILYIAMNYVVVPLSAAHASGHFAASVTQAADRLREAFAAFRPQDPWQLAGTIFAHTALVGVPIALAAKRFLNQ